MNQANAKTEPTNEQRRAALRALRLAAYEWPGMPVDGDVHVTAACGPETWELRMWLREVDGQRETVAFITCGGRDLPEVATSAELSILSENASPGRAGAHY